MKPIQLVQSWEYNGMIYKTHWEAKIAKAKDEITSMADFDDWILNTIINCSPEMLKTLANLHGKKLVDL